MAQYHTTIKIYLQFKKLEHYGTEGTTKGVT